MSLVRLRGWRHHLQVGAACCEGKRETLVALRRRQSRVLKTVLIVNATMFVVEVAVGFLTRSSSVLADSLDMFGDALVYASSLYVLERGRVWQARMAMLKGAIMAVFGVGVLADVALKAVGARPPIAEGMGAVGATALAANLFCLYLLTRHRDDDVNMRSVWICSRNDIVANIGVLLAAAAVGVVHSRWPDIVVGTIIATVFLSSAIRVLRDGIAESRGGSAGSRAPS